MPGFPRHSPLRAELVAAVDDYFARTGLARDGGAGMWAKSLALITWAVASWALLVFWAGSWWVAAPLAVSLGLALAGVSFAIMHDGNHGAYSRRRLLNAAAGSTMEVMGGSSHVWKHKHNVLHHTWPNVDGVDDDIELRPFFRLTDGQPRRWMHRFQHLYWVPLFSLFTSKWIFVDDYLALARGAVGGHAMARPRGLGVAAFAAGKLSFLVWGVVIPLLWVPLLPYLLGYAIAASVWGLTMGLVFQLAHAIQGVEVVLGPGPELPRPWAEHQLATTADFARGNRLLTWYVGGLNHQVEHHLFPGVCHRHYPAIAGIVREVCATRGIVPHEHPTVLSALRAHLRHLRRLGAPEPSPVPVAA